MDHLPDADCWLHVLGYLHGDHHSLFQLMQTCKAMFRSIVPILYQRPLLEYKLSFARKQSLDALLKNCLATSRSSADVSDLISPKQPSPTTLNYYNLVKEMPNPFYLNSFPVSKEDIQQLKDHLCDFGSKVKSIKISIGTGEDWSLYVEYLGNLEKLVILEYHPIIDESTYEVVRNVIRSHRVTFPGVLKHVSYSIQSTCSRQHSDPKMMLVIRDAMDGKWSTDTAELKIPTGKDDHLLKVLEDEDLPRQLRVVTIDYADIHKASHWIQPIRNFLLRCRALDSIKFIDCQLETVSWILDEHQVVEARTMAISKRVCWKRIDIQNNMQLQPVSEYLRIQDLWQIAVIGFGQCVEFLRFSVESEQTDPTETYMILSLPATVHLPKLKSLFVRCCSFGELAYTGIEKLQHLDLSINDLSLNKDQSNWQDWKRWSNLQTLYLNAPIPRSVGFFKWEKFDRTNVERTEQDGVMDSQDQKKSDSILPRLEHFYFKNQLPYPSGLEILLIAPNLSHLSIYNFSGRIQADWSEFFDEAFSRSTVFSNLKSITTDIPVDLKPNHFGYLLGLLHEKKVDLFPALEGITFEACPRGRHDMVECVVMDNDLCMKMVEDAIRSGHGHSRGKIVRVNRYKTPKYIEKKWEQLSSDKEIQKYFHF